MHAIYQEYCTWQNFGLYFDISFMLTILPRKEYTGGTTLLVLIVDILHSSETMFCPWQDLIAETEVFYRDQGGASSMASDMNVPFLGKIPMDPSLSR